MTDTLYNFVKQQVDNGTWLKTQAVFGKNAATLDLYFRIYSLVLQYYPERGYGYAVKFVNNEHIMRIIGGGIRPI